MSSKRWIFQIDSLRNVTRPPAPGVTITRRNGSGVPQLPPTGKRRRKPFGGR